jgi:phosphotriesterase-related protein
LSHDIGSKHRLASYGGHGYVHLLKYVYPRFLRKGITKEQLEMMFVGNPRRLLAFV